MQFLPGAPLSEVLPTLHESDHLAGDRRLPRLIARIMADLAESLHAAHVRDLVYGSVCPHDLHVLHDGSVGIVRGQCEQRTAYQAPEQLERGRADRRSDIWSLGVVAWELLVGRRLFRCSSDPATVAAVLEREIEPPSSHKEGIPVPLDRIVMRALDRDPCARYQSARELANDLERFLGAPDAVPASEVAAWLGELFPQRRQAPAERELDEHALPDMIRRVRSRRISGTVLLAASLLAIGMASLEFFSGTPVFASQTTAAPTGVLTVSTPGSSVDVIHRGNVVGKTPLTLSLSAGTHELILRGNGTESRVTIPITAGQPASLSVPFPAPVSRAQ